MLNHSTTARSHYLFLVTHSRRGVEGRRDCSRIPGGHAKAPAPPLHENIPEISVSIPIRIRSECVGLADLAPLTVTVGAAECGCLLPGGETVRNADFDQNDRGSCGEGDQGHPDLEQPWGTIVHRGIPATPCVRG